MKGITIALLGVLLVSAAARLTAQGTDTERKKGTMDKVLVTYATKAGSTAEVAEAIGKALREDGLAVDVLPAKDVKDLSGYRAAVVGSGIYAGKWLPDAVQFVERNQSALKAMPVAYFVVCATMKDDNEKARQEVAKYSEPVRALVQPLDTGLFGGVINYAKMNFFLRFMLKNLMKAPEGDFRNWEAIRAWAKKIAPRLAGAQ